MESKSKKCSGSYLLILYLDQLIDITVGSLGYCNFKSGYYVYIGSAMNQQLINRVSRHTRLSQNKKFHWHIDFLLANSHVLLERSILIPSLQKEECIISQQIAVMSKGLIAKFGSTDCKCASHLYYLGNSCPFWKNM